MKKCLGFLLCLATLSMPVAGRSATSNGCDKDDNVYIVPELALCSTHVFNIGKSENPTTEDERAYMRAVVALKSEMMTQQMNKQYEYLESMIRRFKTQLEKAVLKTRLQTSGAGEDDSSSGSASGFKSDDRNVYLPEVSNCLNVYQYDKKLKCYEDNLNVIINMSNHGNMIDGNLKKQLWFDYKYLADLKFGESKGCIVDTKCTDNNKGMTKSQFQTCLNDMRSCLSNQYNAYNNQQLKLKSNK